MYCPSYVLIFQIFFIIWNLGSTCTPLNSDSWSSIRTTPNIPLVFKASFTFLADSSKWMEIHVLLCILILGS